MDFSENDWLTLEKVVEPEFCVEDSLHGNYE